MNSTSRCKGVLDKECRHGHPWPMCVCSLPGTRCQHSLSNTRSHGGRILGVGVAGAGGGNLLSKGARLGVQAGFTLIEVMVSMAIMVFISLAIYQAMTETYKLREVLSVEGDFYNSIRLA